MDDAVPASSPNRERGRRGHVPRAVVVHTTDGGWAGTLAWFRSSASRVSAHYVVGLDGRVADVVDEEDTAFHAGMEPVPSIPVLGDDPPNLVTVGIEFDDGGDPHEVERPDAQYRSGAVLLAAVADRWSIPLDRDHVIDHRAINPHKTCPGNLDVERLLDEARRILADQGSATSRPRLVVLLPARNAAADLPAWFASVEPIADAVVALDDGSTDDTAELLAAHRLVSTLLRNPRRDTYEGWDDSANRNRLLTAALDLDADWILSLDADERLAPDDATALRHFIDTDALPGLAYGFQCFRMIGDDRHYDRNGLWVYRLFAAAPGQRFPEERLHFVPVPVDIPRPRWVKTTLRIQHFSSLTAERRRARFDKYRQADPDVEHQAGYDHLLDDPDDVLPFDPRPSDLPVLADAPATAADVPAPAIDPDAPALSAIVISRDDEARIERTVRSVVDQECDEPFEVIVVTSGTDRTADIVRERFPEVALVALDRPALPGAARNAGLAVARGDYVSFPGSHVELPPGSLAARIRAHDAGWTMVTGTTQNGTDTASGWAAYFLDHSTVLPGRPSQQLSAPPAHCSYDARALREVGGFPEDVRAGEDTWVNEQLFRRGGTAFRAADVPLVHHNRSRTPVRLVRHHFQRGRAQVQFFRRLEPGAGGEQRARRFLDGYQGRRMARIDANVQAWGAGLEPRYRRVRPLVRLGVLAAWAGAQVELRRPSLPSTAPGAGTDEPAVGQSATNR